MKNKLRRIITAFLAIVMLFSLMMPAMAEQQKKPVYLCLGDSIASGAALTIDGTEYNPDKIWKSCLGFRFETMLKAYHSLVATGLGADLIMGARAAMRTVELRSLLGGGYNDYDPNYTWYGYWKPNWGAGVGWNCGKTGDIENDLAAGFDFKKFEEFNSTLASYDGYADAIKAADVISLNFGANDVFSSVLVTALMNNYSKLAQIAGGTQIIAQIGSCIQSGDLAGAFSKLIEANKLLGTIGEFAATFLKEMAEAKLTFKANYTWLISKIRKLNPDATIVGVSVFNMLNYGAISEELKDLDVSAAMELSVKEINSFIRSFSLIDLNYFYADVTETETHNWTLKDALKFVSGGDNAWVGFLTFLMNVHPTLKGHNYIANQILNAIPKADGGYSNSKLLDLFETSFIYRLLDSVFGIVDTGISGVFNFVTSGFTYLNPFVK